LDPERFIARKVNLLTAHAIFGIVATQSTATRSVKQRDTLHDGLLTRA